MASKTSAVKKADWGTGREALLKAALEEFANSGYRGASVSAIAKKIGVTQPLINHHFGSKEGLWRAVIDWAFGMLAEQLAAGIDTTQSARQQLLSAARQWVYFCARHPEVARIVTNETTHPSEAFDYIFEQHMKPMTDAMQAVMKNARDQGVYDGDSRVLQLIIVGAGMQPFTEPEIVRRAFRTNPFSKSYIKRYADTIVEMLEAWMPPEC